MALHHRPYYPNTLNQSDDHTLTNDSRGHYPDLEPSLAHNAHIYSLADGAFQAHQHSTDREFAGLIQAATAAAGQESSYTQDHDKVYIPRRMTRQAANMSARSQQPSTSTQSFSNKVVSDAPAHKRRRQSHPTRLQRVSSSARLGHLSQNNAGLEAPSSHHIRPNTRFAGLQSATALFRSPSASSKKYTRPPISKMFTSLELTPENFLHLQAAAKAYMLDLDHPERRDCVGQRGKGDSELVKMRLWTCVANFLDEEGRGQSHFGEHVPGAEGTTRGMVWPTDRNSIIGAVLPLLRRMVTNERQRQYAVEARKGGNTGSGKRRSSSPELPSPAQRDIGQGGRDGSEMEGLRIDGPDYPPGEEVRSMPSVRSRFGTTPDNGSLMLHLNIIENKRRILPSYQSLAEDCPDLQSIHAKVLQYYGDAALDRAAVSVLLPQGLTSIASNEEWTGALSIVQDTEWMDGETKVVVDFP